MEDRTVSQLEVKGGSFVSPLLAAQVRQNKNGSSGIWPSSTCVTPETQPIRDGAVRAQLRRQFSHLSSPNTSPNSSFVLSGPHSAQHGTRHRRGRIPSEGHFSARVVACTPSPVSSAPASAHTSATTRPSQAPLPSDRQTGPAGEVPLRASVVSCRSTVEAAVRDLQRAMSLLAEPDDGEDKAHRSRGASDTVKNGFIWLDLHGVPHRHRVSVAEATAARTSATSASQLGNPLAPLWDCLHIAPCHRAALDEVLVRRHAASRERRHQARASHPRRARPSDASLHATESDTFSRLSLPHSRTGSRSSSTSSSGTDDDDETRSEQPVLDIIGLADLYDEQLDDVPEADTVDVQASDQPRTGAYAEHYALLQLAAQLNMHAMSTSSTNTLLSAAEAPPATNAAPLSAEEGWTVEAATAAGDLPLHSHTPDTSASVFERERARIGRLTQNASWARALNTSLLAMPSQHALHQSFLGMPPSPMPASPHAGVGGAVWRSTGVATRANADDHSGSLTPIVGLYVICFPNLCVTWCPSSTLSLATDAHSDATPPQADTHLVQGWEQLQQAVFTRIAGSSAGVSAGASAATLAAARREPLCTATFLAMLLTTVCSAYLPDTAAILSEVDAIDAMMPLIRPDEESDQADALRRVVLLRRKLSVHRRLLYQKVRLLESLDRPVTHTLTRFLIHVPHAHAHDGTHKRTHAKPTVEATHGSAVVAASAAPPMTAAAVEKAVRSIGNAFTSEVILQHGSTRLVGEVLAAVRDDTNVVKPLRASLVRVHQQLEGARVVLGNTTLIYSSSVARANSSTSTDSDFFQVKVSYISLIVMPLSALVSQFGMNCMVPGQFEPWPRTFVILIGIIVMIMLAGAALPQLIRRVGHSKKLF